MLHHFSGIIYLKLLAMHLLICYLEETSKPFIQLSLSYISWPTRFVGQVTLFKRYFHVNNLFLTKHVILRFLLYKFTLFKSMLLGVCKLFIILLLHLTGQYHCLFGKHIKYIKILRLVNNKNNSGCNFVCKKM